MADPVEVVIEVPQEEEPEIIEEASPAVEAAEAGVAVAAAAVALSEQTTAAAELQAAVAELTAEERDAQWRTSLETTIFSRLSESETRMMEALSALNQRLEILSTPPAPLVVETPQGEELILPAEEVAQAQAAGQESGAAESPVLQTRPKRHRWI